MSHAALDRSVQPVIIDENLDVARISFYNYRLNEHGRKIVLRMQHDNLHLLVTQPAFNIFRRLGYIKVIEKEVYDVKTKKNKIKKETIINENMCKTFAQEQFYRIIQPERYSNEVMSMYAEVKKISFRSKFKKSAYFKVMNGYGHNRDKEIDPVYAAKIISVLDLVFKAWATNPIFNFDLKTEFETGRWLTHIKTNSNSGYPSNIKQSKELMVPAAGVSLQLFDKWLKGDKIDWHKLSFEMGYRTERDDKHRVVCMAAEYEKPISALISTFLDLTAKDLPFNLPRKFGAFKNIADEIFKSDKGRLFSKDFEAFDTSVPISLVRILRDWFKNIPNTFCKLIAFECDLIINSYMIIGPNKSFWIASLPSGIGVTQFIGSLIHWLIDTVVELVSSFAVYQSDDNLCITEHTDEELQAKMDKIKEVFGMDVSPVGKKSFISKDYNKFLQKVIDRKNKIFYNHEQRAYTNALFREREITDDTLFETVFGLDADAPENKSKKAVLAYLGNLVSFGQFAPSLPEIFSFLYGKTKTGFTVTQIQWGLKNIEQYMEQFLHQEEHRPKEDTGWCSQLFNSCLKTYGWTNITPVQVLNAATAANLKLYPTI